MDTDTLRGYWGLFVQAWWLFRKYRNVRADEEWNQLIEEATTLREKYPGDFSKKIIMAILDELERRQHD